MIISGFVLTFRLWGGLGDLTQNAAGITLLVGTIASISAAIVGSTILTPTGRRIQRISQVLAGRQPSAEEGGQLKRLSGRLETFSRLNLLLILIAVITMSVMRYL